ncbi:MAG: lactate racemase domain-containing protein [Gemmatimonadota bacterium]|nr:lactate racemase domain-containing protein [Gemmatimonadota bacterium]
MDLPRMFPLRQKFDADSLDDPVEEVRRCVLNSSLGERVSGGARVAITAGSRGIHRIARLTRAVADCVREMGGVPFILAAMGSHGGATADGQKAILASYGIDESTMGAPVDATMDVVKVGETEDGVPVVLNRLANEADAVVLVNRVKPHTSFRGPFESGLMKMMTIGLGSHRGATLAHSMGAAGLPRMIPAWGRIILQEAPIALGVAILENAYEQTAKVAAVEPDQLAAVEPGLLDEARELMPRIPVDRIDVLIVDRIGKNISGTGMDPNIIGRIWLAGIEEPDSPRIERVVVLDLTPETHGNANGIGLADVTTRRLVDNIDFKATYANAMTSTFLNRAYIPIVGENDREAIEIALGASGNGGNTDARVMRIRSTLELEYLRASESLLPELSGMSDVEVSGEAEAMNFDGEGNLTTSGPRSG